MRKMSAIKTNLFVDVESLKITKTTPSTNSSADMEDIDLVSSPLPKKSLSNIKTIKSNGNLLLSMNRPGLDIYQTGLHNFSARDKISQIDDEEYYGETYDNPDDLEDRFTIHNHDQSTLSTQEKKSLYTVHRAGVANDDKTDQNSEQNCAGNNNKKGFYELSFNNS